MASFDFDALKDKVGGLVQSGISKSKEITEITKLKVASMGEEDTIKKAYIEIGKLYYAERGMAPEPAYAALCEKITASKVNIEENKNRVEELKAAGNMADIPMDPEVEDLAQDPAPAEEDVPPEVPPQE